MLLRNTRAPMRFLFPSASFLAIQRYDMRKKQIYGKIAEKA